MSSKCIRLLKGVGLFVILACAVLFTFDKFYFRTKSFVINLGMPFETAELLLKTRGGHRIARSVISSNLGSEWYSMPSGTMLVLRKQNGPFGLVVKGLSGSTKVVKIRGYTRYDDYSFIDLLQYDVVEDTWVATENDPNDIIVYEEPNVMGSAEFWPEKQIKASDLGDFQLPTNCEFLPLPSINKEQLSIYGYFRISHSGCCNVYLGSLPNSQNIMSVILDLSLGNEIICSDQKVVLNSDIVIKQSEASTFLGEVEAKPYTLRRTWKLIKLENVEISDSILKMENGIYDVKLSIAKLTVAN